MGYICAQQRHADSSCAVHISILASNQRQKHRRICKRLSGGQTQVILGNHGVIFCVFLANATIDFMPMRNSFCICTYYFSLAKWKHGYVLGNLHVGDRAKECMARGRRNCGIPCTYFFLGDSSRRVLHVQMCMFPWMPCGLHGSNVCIAQHEHVFRIATYGSQNVQTIQLLGHWARIFFMSCLTAV